MAIKNYRAKETGVHALTGISLVRGEEYSIDESLAGTELFEEIKASPAAQADVSKDKKSKQEDK